MGAFSTNSRKEPSPFGFDPKQKFHTGQKLCDTCDHYCRTFSICDGTDIRILGCSTILNRDDWEDGNPGSWGTTPQYQSESPSWAYEAPTPGGSYSDAGTPRDSSSAYANASIPYFSSTPGGQPMTPNSAVYLAGTPGGQPMMPGTGSLDVMSPVMGGDNIGPRFMPDILVNVRKSSNDSAIGVIREVFGDGLFKMVLGANGNGDTITAFSSEIEAVVPKQTDKINVTA